MNSPSLDAGDALLRRITRIDEILDTHASALGDDFLGYRNHVYRVANLCVVLAGRRADLDTIATAAAFHDLGIWTNRTFDYIPPSVALAHEYFVAGHRVRSTSEVEQMIVDHHKITSSTAQTNWLVEPFRQADWVDVTRGLRGFGLQRSLIRTLFTEWPSAGFHRRLAALTIGRLYRHPSSPLPMFKW